ncbi:hypothetical protein LKR43_10835 [Pusillimonas sp. MFBS29]|uniref:hypothetical protein n=1 Tax=Pusillimonas sp. MFBS29 TaxID=2886690 RepID=UPI001D12A9D3|nr:hypothetical protein [Pusillimonas sp. MFBS29]MCC2596835.1 hypothetical protein [Pusillimonas sp. MFBS29]
MFDQRILDSTRARHIKRQHPAYKYRQHLVFDAVTEHRPALASGHQGYTGAQFGHSHGCQIKRFQRLAIQPADHRFIGYGSKLLRYNVRIQQDHSKLAARAGEWSRSKTAISSSVNFTLRPIPANKSPSFTWPSGFTAVANTFYCQIVPDEITKKPAITRASGHFMPSGAWSYQTRDHSHSVINKKKAVLNQNIESTHLAGTKKNTIPR